MHPPSLPVQHSSAGRSTKLSSLFVLSQPDNDFFIHHSVLDHHCTVQVDQTAILALPLFSPAEAHDEFNRGRPHPCMRLRLSTQRQHKDLILRCTMARAGSNSTLGMASPGRIRPKTPTPPNEENSTSNSPPTRPRVSLDSQLSSRRIVPSCSQERVRSCRTLEPLLAPWSASAAPPDTSSPRG